MCEKNLSTAFYDGMQNMSKDISRIEILNMKEYPDNINFEIIDFCQYFGVLIDREECRLKGCETMSGRYRYGRNDTDIFKLFMPRNITYNDDLFVTFEMVLRAETNLKLDLIDLNGNRLIKDPKETEVHFIKLESVVDRISLSLGSIFKTLKKVFTKNADI